MEIKLKDVIVSANTGADAIQRAPIVDYDTGIKCLRIGDISNKRTYSDWGFTNVNEDNYKRYKLKKGNIIIARTGSTVGINKYIESDYKSVYNNGLIRLTIDETKYNSRFIYYIIQMKEFKNYINGIAFGTTGQPNIQINDLLNYKFNDINLEKQNKIVNILEIIDKKIELNNKINDNLSKLTNEIYNDFYNQNDGKIYNLEDLVKFSQGKQIGVEQQYLEMKEGLKRFLRIVDFTNPNEPKRYVEDYGDRYWANYEEIIMIRYGSQTCGDVIRGKEGIIANNMFKVIPNNKNLNNYLFYYLSSDKIQNYIKGAQNSSTMPSINFGLLNKLEIKVILEQKINEFNNIIEPIRKKKIEIELQNETLEQLRDTLLPKLMSGEINLDYIEV